MLSCELFRDKLLDLLIMDKEFLMVQVLLDYYLEIFVTSSLWVHIVDSNQ